VSVAGTAVGVAAELSVVGPPRVGGFDDPAQAQPDGLFLAELFGAAALDVEIFKPEDREPGADDG
jgi:hypothetical protein